MTNAVPRRGDLHARLLRCMPPTEYRSCRQMTIAGRTDIDPDSNREDEGARGDHRLMVRQLASSATADAGDAASSTKRDDDLHRDHEGRRGRDGRPEGRRRRRRRKRAGESPPTQRAQSTRRGRRATAWAPGAGTSRLRRQDATKGRLRTLGKWTCDKYEGFADGEKSRKSHGGSDVQLGSPRPIGFATDAAVFRMARTPSVCGSAPRRQDHLRPCERHVRSQAGETGAPSGAQVCRLAVSRSVRDITEVELVRGR